MQGQIREVLTYAYTHNSRDMSHVYGPDGRVRRPVKKLYTLDKENVDRYACDVRVSTLFKAGVSQLTLSGFQERWLTLCRVSRKKVVNSPAALQEEQAISSKVLNTLYSQ